MEQLEKIIKKFIDNWDNKKVVTGVLLTGSYSVGNENKYSDVDLYVILSDDVNWRERGNKIIDGHLIEYFANPPRMIHKYFEGEAKEFDRTTIRMFATGKIIFDNNGNLKTLVDFAKNNMKSKFKNLSDNEVESIKYAIWDAFDDMKILYENSDKIFDYVYFNNLNRVLEYYRKYIKAEAISISKIYKYFTNSSFRKNYQIEEFTDNIFVKKFNLCIESKNNDDKYSNFKDLIEYVLYKMGGFEIDGWKLKSEV